MGGNSFPFCFHLSFSCHQNTPFLSCLRGSLSSFFFSVSRIGTCRIRAYLINDVFNLTVERDSALKENQTLQKTIQLLKRKNMNCQRGYQALQKRYNNLKMSKKPEAVKKTQQETVKLGDKVTKQKSEFEEKLSCKKRKEMMTAAAMKKELESATKAKTSLQAQVVKLENKLKDCQIQMSEQEERFRKETNTERLKSDRLEEEVSRLKSRLMETIRPGRKCLVWLLP